MVGNPHPVKFSCMHSDVVNYSVIYAFNMTFGKHMFSTTESRFQPVPTFVAIKVVCTTPGLVKIAPPS
jgi:hypothetical protein